MTALPPRPADLETTFQVAKKKYEPPALLKISLRPEEAVLGNCKTSRVAGPVSFSCSAVGPCRTVGS
jgi:hypothetical protein